MLDKLQTAKHDFPGQRSQSRLRSQMKQPGPLLAISPELRFHPGILAEIVMTVCRRVTILSLFLAVGEVWAQQAPSLPASNSLLSARVDRQGDPLPAGSLARFGTTRFRFGMNVQAAALSSNGQWIASSNDGNSVS